MNTSNIYAILLLILNFIFIGAYSGPYPKCENCKSFIQNGKDNNMGFCKIFANFANKEKPIYNYAPHCRDNQYLCGKEGWLFEKNDNFVDLIEKNEIKKIQKNTKLLLNKLSYSEDYIKNNDEQKAYDEYIMISKKYNLPTPKKTYIW
jgi:hypothetical protein